MRVLVTGSRELTDYSIVAAELGKLLTEHGSLTVVHGKNEKGADAHAAAWCKLMRALGKDVTEEAHPADWSTHGKHAGIMRNDKMCKLGADLCLAFPRGKSSGTRDCIMRANNYMIPVIYG